MAAHFFGQLAGFIITHIARRGTDQAGHRVLFHILTHVNGDQRVHGIKQLIGQLLDQLGFAHAGGADKDKACRAVAARQVCPRTLNGQRYAVHSFVLADDMLFQGIFQPHQAAILGLFDFNRRNAGPQLHNLGHIVRRYLDIGHAQLQRGQLLAQLSQLGLGFGQFLVINSGIALLFGVGVFQVMLFGFQLCHLLLQVQKLGNFRVAQVAAGAGFIQQVNGLIRQVAVGDIPFRQVYHIRHDGIGHTHAVVLFVITFYAADNRNGIIDGGFFHLDGLEAALQRRIFFNKLAVLGKGRCADNLDLPAGQGRFHDVGGVHGAVRIPGADNVVDLVNEQDHIAGGLDFRKQALDALFKLAAELGACHKGRQVQQVDLFIL